MRIKTTFERTLVDLRTCIKNLNVYRSVYENPRTGVMTDKLGTITIISDNATPWSPQKEAHRRGSYIIRNDAGVAMVDCLPSHAEYINLRNDIANNRIILSGVNASGAISFAENTYTFGYVVAPSTLILSRQHFGSLRFIVDINSFSRGMYLNYSGTNILSTENWIYNTHHINAAFIGITIDFDAGYNMTPMYLNRLYLSSTTFSNLANKLGNVANGKLILGTKNIANMTETQKNAITAKGWTIS